jgi:hypothetical protein
MFRLFIEFWPVLLPLVLYILWMLRRRRRAVKAGETVPEWREGPWMWAIVATFLLIMGGLLILGLSAESNRDSAYKPTQLKDGKLIQERFE